MDEYQRACIKSVLIDTAGSNDEDLRVALGLLNGFGLEIEAELTWRYRKQQVERERKRTGTE